MTTLRQLEAFRAVMLVGSVTGAAEFLRLTQPTISKLVAQLERATELTLFDRNRGRLIPRPEADTLLHQVEKVFSAVEDVGRNARQLAKARAGHIRIVAIPPLALRFLPSAVATFLETHPDVRITLQVRGSSYIAEWIASEQADVGFASGGVQADGVVTERFQSATAVCVIPAGHPLCRKARLEPKDFAGERFIGLGRVTAFRELLDRAFADAGIERRIVAETGYSSVACALVAGGAGVTIVDQVSALDAFESGGLALRPFNLRIPFETSVLYKAQAARSLVVEAFLKHLEGAKRETDSRLAKIMSRKSNGRR